MTITFGAMNHPAEPIVKSINTIARLGFDFVDLTLEGPAAAPLDALANIKKIKAALSKTGLEVVGHTAWYLDIGSPIEAVRRAVLSELKICVDVFSRLGAEKMNVHPTHLPKTFKNAEATSIRLNAKTLIALAGYAKPHGIEIMVENAPYETFRKPAMMARLLAAAPVKFHLDMGHANVNVKRNSTEEFLRLLGKKLIHVHAHDNKGKEDQHLPIGEGNINWKSVVSALKKIRYNNTITIEVFSTPQKLKGSRIAMAKLLD